MRLLVRFFLLFQFISSHRKVSKYTRTKKKRRVTYKDIFNRYNVILRYILNTIFIDYPAFHFRPSNSEQDINLTDLHYSRPSNEIIMWHILCTRLFFFVLTYIFGHKFSIHVFLFCMFLSASDLCFRTICK